MLLCVGLCLRQLTRKDQVMKMVQYVVEQAPDGSDDKRNYR